MILNRIWIGMFLVSMAVGLSKLIFWKDTEIFKEMFEALMSAGKTGFEVSLFLTGAICLWMGIMADRVAVAHCAVVIPVYEMIRRFNRGHVWRLGVTMPR